MLTILTMAKPTGSDSSAEPTVVRVRALRTGYYGKEVGEQQLRPEGSEFDFHRLPLPKGGLQPIPSWCEALSPTTVPTASVPPTQQNASTLEASLSAVM